MPIPKGTSKAKSDKYERCVKKVKKRSSLRRKSPKVNPYAVCHASVFKKKKSRFWHFFVSAVNLKGSFHNLFVRCDYTKIWLSKLIRRYNNHWSKIQKRKSHISENISKFSKFL